MAPDKSRMAVPRGTPFLMANDRSVRYCKLLVGVLLVVGSNVTGEAPGEYLKLGVARHNDRVNS